VLPGGPEGGPFALQSERCRYLIIGNLQPHDVAVHPETGRVSVKLMDEAYRGSATMGYWEGVEADEF
jgi:hypothetical protein